MSSLVELQEKIRSTSAMIGRMEAELVSRRESRAIASNIISLNKLHENLRYEFEQVASDMGVDLLDYRLLVDRPTARSLARSIDGFQESFSLTYDARKAGPKLRRRVSDEALIISELHTAYTYPGSFGIVFSIPNEQLLLPEHITDLEEAAATVLDIAKSPTNTEQIKKASAVLGRGTIAAIYEWSRENSLTGTGIAVNWRRQGESKTGAIVQPQEFAAVAHTIESISDPVITQETLVGTLVGADTQLKTFRFLPDRAGKAIRGRFTDAISDGQKASIPQRYRAIIQKIVTQSLVTEVEKPAYTLKALEPTSEKPPGGLFVDEDE